MTSIMKARAKRTDNKELVEGYYFSSIQGHWIDTTPCTESHEISSEDYVKIDPSTLEYQIGDEWLSEDEITERCSESLASLKKSLVVITKQRKELYHENARLRAELKRIVNTSIDPSDQSDNRKVD